MTGDRHAMSHNSIGAERIFRRATGHRSIARHTVLMVGTSGCAPDSIA